jgi:hypothetical protein
MTVPQPVSVMLAKITLRLPALGNGYEDKDEYPDQVIRQT